ncbi:hypothetical protein PMZ80_006604 [Knufia obscura]|uniref:Uncharacterized protein n=2 Tax=Knufia TaxID=430999 RepID=A0AAN8EGH8_9EURO|nr:hypothetical protein PMZ80_006604 [Knufia obscura]KAK5950963.1 hypothetical protein OHC33_008035 [Knufia fluminis]
MNRTANPSATGSQRKRNINQARTNVASQQNNNSNSQQQKKGNKQSQQQSNSKPSTSTPASKPTPPPVPQPEKHVPLSGFNGEDIDHLLTRGVDAEAGVYKPEKTVTQKTGPWGQKPGTMVTGKDFWLELRKQVATLQKGGSTNKGG